MLSKKNKTRINLKYPFLLASLIPAVFVFLHFPVSAASYPGLPTRSQNPLLQGYFIPASPITIRDRWSFSHSLSITNTFQQEQNSSEKLIIDVENTRYDFQASYLQQDWILNINLSLISNQGGFLDHTIESWHDIFGLPQNGRDSSERNRMRLFYQQQGNTLFDSHRSTTGLGDIQLAAGYRLEHNSQLWFAIELPSNSDEFFSNDGFDLALWYSVFSNSSEKLAPYGTLGAAIPADSGLFENRLNSHFFFAQIGLIYAYQPAYHFFVQSDMHSKIVSGSQLDALGNSLQAQFGLRLPALIDDHQLDIFFSEDIFPGHAPDITFGIRLSPSFN